MFFAMKIFIVAKPPENTVKWRFALTEWRKNVIDVD